VIAVARVRTGVVARVFVDTAVALARARDMFALMFVEVIVGGGVVCIVDGWKRGSRVVTGLQLERTLYFLRTWVVGRGWFCSCTQIYIVRVRICCFGRRKTLASAHRLARVRPERERR
jgi:hypothetical protein